MDTSPDLNQTIADVKAAQQGDERALGDLIQRYYPWVRQTVSLRMGRSVRDGSDVEDLMQESMLDAFRSIDRFSPTSEGSFRNWLARIVENNIRDLRRRQSAEKRGADRTQRFRDLFTSAMSDPGIPANDRRPSSLAHARELEAMLEVALLKMSERHREAIILRDRCGMDYSEIAQEIGLKNAATARVLHARAKQKLEEIVAAG